MPSAGMPLPPERGPCVVISANSCRNLVHFRGRLLSALHEAGFRLVALAPLDDHAPELRRRQIEVWPIPIVRSGTNPIADARLLLCYVRLLLRLRPVAHCSFTIKANVYGGIAARICRIPLVANISGLGTTFLAQGFLWQFAVRLYRIALRRAHTVFFHNVEDLQTFLKARIVSPQQSKVIPGSGVDLARFAPAPPPVHADQDKVFLFVGRLIRDKGVREYVEAARSLKALLPTARFQLLGNLDPENRTSITPAELQSWIEEGVIEYLRERDDVRPLMRSATAVVLPSYREGMSRALLEAAAMGKPLVGTDVPGVRELVEEGVTGALGKPRDVRSLARALERIARMPASRLLELGANARARVERRYDEEFVTGAYLEALDEILRLARVKS